MSRMSSDTFRAFGLALLAGLDYYLAAAGEQPIAADPSAGAETGSETVDDAMIAYLGLQDQLYALDPQRSVLLDQQLAELFSLPRDQREQVLAHQARSLFELGHSDAAHAVARRLGREENRAMLHQEFLRCEEQVDWLPDPEPEAPRSSAGADDLPMQLTFDL